MVDATHPFTVCTGTLSSSGDVVYVKIGGGDPVKAFADEVCSDTVGDAGRFYKAQARRAKRGAEQARERTREKMAAIRREQEEMKKRRRAMMKRAALALALLALLSLLILSAALSSASAWAAF